MKRRGEGLHLHHIPGLTKPPGGVLRSYGPNCSVQEVVNFKYVIAVGHNVTDNPALASYVSLDSGERWLDRVEVRGIRWKELDTHSSIQIQIQCCSHELKCSPSLDHLHNERRFVDAAIVHDNDRVGSRERVHVLEECFNKFGK